MVTYTAQLDYRTKNMTTYQMTKEEAVSSKKWFVIDAAGLPVGRVATQAARYVRGKHKPQFTPHVDCGDFVIVINAEKAVFTGNKETQKKYYHHTGYPGGIKETTPQKLRETAPERIIQNAVKGMVKKGTLGYQIIKKLKVYAGTEHPHQAQSPEVLTV